MNVPGDGREGPEAPALDRRPGLPVRRKATQNQFQVQVIDSKIHFGIEVGDSRARAVDRGAVL